MSRICCRKQPWHNEWPSEYSQAKLRSSRPGVHDDGEGLVGRPHRVGGRDGQGVAAGRAGLAVPEMNTPSVPSLGLSPAGMMPPVMERASTTESVDEELPAEAPALAESN